MAHQSHAQDEEGRESANTDEEYGEDGVACLGLPRRVVSIAFTDAQLPMREPVARRNRTVSVPQQAENGQVEKIGE